MTKLSRKYKHHPYIYIYIYLSTWLRRSIVSRKTSYRRCCTVHKYFPYKHPSLDFHRSQELLTVTVESINFWRLPDASVASDDNTTATGGAIHGARLFALERLRRITWKTKPRHEGEDWDLRNDHPRPPWSRIHRTGEKSTTRRLPGTSPVKEACSRPPCEI